ncbi:MAG TPA: hypothetical protein VFG14_17990 [Chthoniobacteraceae bacterium]|jgi:hypothetical protein|nr:hypothetical protein [Chthoniobacteraceae bacterium]
MNKLAIIAAVVILAAVGAKKTMELPKAKVTLRAMDEQGNPIEGAEAFLGFERPIPTFGGGAVVPAKGLTDAQGEFTGEGHSFDTQGGRLSKQGYYTGNSKSFKFEKSVLGKWQPWNPAIDVVLKRVINPTPMYAKRVNIGIPAFGKDLGFDLVTGDWVAPHGLGKTSDFLITANLDKRAEDDFDYKLTISFPNKGDGIQVFAGDPQSALKSPHMAPESGYAPEWNQTRRSRADGPEKTTRDDNRNYFFRVRTVLNEKGDVDSAHYGKTYGDFMNFIYYLNPKANDRSMEFDPKQNLLQNVSGIDRVNDP